MEVGEGIGSSHIYITRFEKSDTSSDMFGGTWIQKKIWRIFDIQAWIVPISSNAPLDGLQAAP